MKTSDLNHVSQYFYFMWNRFSEKQCNLIWKNGNAAHFWNKWTELHGKPDKFYAELSEYNRDILLNHIIEFYKNLE